MPSDFLRRCSRVQRELGAGARKFYWADSLWASRRNSPCSGRQRCAAAQGQQVLKVSARRNRRMPKEKMQDQRDPRIGSRPLKKHKFTHTHTHNHARARNRYK